MDLARGFPKVNLLKHAHYLIQHGVIVDEVQRPILIEIRAQYSLEFWIRPISHHIFPICAIDPISTSASGRTRPQTMHQRAGLSPGKYSA